MDWLQYKPFKFSKIDNRMKGNRYCKYCRKNTKHSFGRCLSCGC